MQRYEKYKDSDIDSLGEIPEHWGIKKLKYLANVNPSNIDKKSKNDEQEILLCNYVDVYKNEYINSDLDFMKATATDEQIAKFILRKGDVIATKDSESPDDIGVPALVTEDFDNVVCGYHLNHIKPSSIFGDYLFRWFQTQYLKSYFEVSANGVTRFGLGVDKFNSTLVLTPPLEEQKAIASYLDQKTAEIDQLIAQKERLIELYEEEKTAIINEAVTKGINPYVKLKPSGIDWLGEIPEHWRLKRLKHSCSDIFLGLTGKVDYVENQGFPLVRANNITNQKLDLSNVRFISEKQHRELTKKNKTRRDDILLTKSGSIGVAALVNIDEEFSIYESIFTLRAKKEIVKAKYLLYFLRSRSCKAQYEKSIVGMGVGHLNMGDIVDVVMSIPPLEEQKTIVDYIEKECARIDTKIAKTKRIIELQKEYRTALISEAVTGKIKVPQVF